MPNELITLENFARGVMEDVKHIAEKCNVPKLALEIHVVHAFGGEVSNADLDWADGQLKGIDLCQ